MKRRYFALLGMLTAMSVTVSAAELSPAAAAWLDAQTNIQTWSADFTQTRRLKSLTQPLTATGRLWFAAPNRFRWELGDPAETIAVHTQEEMMILYPPLKRVERFALGAKQTGPWRDALALLETGFPRSRSELETRFEILSQQVTGDIGQLVLQPRSEAARRMMPRIEIDFDTKDHTLRGTELEFADGSTMRNDFTRTKLNPKIDEQLFAPAIPSDYKIIEPLKRR